MRLSTRLRVAMSILALPVGLGGCVVGTAVGVAGEAAEGAVNITGDVAEGAVKTTGAVAGAVTPGGSEPDVEDADKDREEE
ncbi:MAG: hypothetical protein GVY06_06535 [Alphaproteobacteria bacterium]|jgi:hypothetical protein|nr:hypothetical protein [Alphaproteobacteria bacterium]